MTSHTANGEMTAPPGAIEKELADLLRLVTRPFGDGAVGRHLQEVAQCVVDSLCRLLRVSSCRLHVVDAFMGAALQRLASSPLGENPERAVGDAVTRSLRERRIVSAPEGELVLAVPLLSGDRTLGVLEVRREHGSWTPQDMRLAQLFADGMAVTLERPSTARAVSPVR